jgi:hypothetical protein
MFKSFPIFKRNDAHLVEKKMFEKNKDCPLSKFECFNMQKHFKFVSSFGHINFKNNEKYSKRNYDNPNYYASLVIFQTYKNAI